MNKLTVLLAAAVVFSGITVAVAEPMEGGPYSPPTEPYAACSRDGFSGVQGQNGWYYGYVSHFDTWSNIPDHLTLLDFYDVGQEAWLSSDQSQNKNLLRIDKYGQTKAGGTDPWNTVRYWVSDQTLDTNQVLGGVINDLDPDNGVGVRAWVKIYDASEDATIDVADNWGVTEGVNYYYYTPQQIDPGDWVMFGIGHTGQDQSSDGKVQQWHQHVTPEPASLFLLGLGGLALIRRKR